MDPTELSERRFDRALADPAVTLENLPPRVEECVQSVKERGEDKQSAIKICKAMDEEGQLAAPEAPDRALQGWEVQTPTFEGTTRSGQGQSGALDLEDVGVDDPSAPEFRTKHLAVNPPVETRDDVGFPVVTADNNLALGDLEDAWELAGRFNGDEEALREEIRDLVTEHFPDSELAKTVKAHFNKGDAEGGGDRENAAAVRVHRGLSMGPEVGRTEHTDGSVTYHNLAILAPGEWTDAASGETIFYAPEAIQQLADNPEEHVVDTSVNVNHDHQNQLAQVGHFDPESLQTDAEGTLYADITLHGRTTASEDTIGLVDLALETEGEQGAGGPSVEIPMEGEVTEWDDERGLERMVEFNLSGLSIVTQSASEDVAFEEQFAERGVAMRAAGGAGGVRIMQAGDTVINQSRRASRMQIEDPEELRAALAEADSSDNVEIEINGDSVGAIQDALDGATTPESDAEDNEEPPEQELQGENELGMAQDVIERARQEGFDLAMNTAADLMEFIQSNLDLSEEEESALNQAADAYLQAEEAESLDATGAEGLLDWIREQAGRGGDEEDDEEREEGTSAEATEELRAEIEDLRAELQALKDEPAESRSLRETAAPDEDDGETSPAPVAGRVTEERGYLSR